MTDGLIPVSPEVDALAHALYDEMREFGSPEHWPNPATNYWRELALRVSHA